MNGAEQTLAIAIVVVPLAVIWIVALFHIIARRSDLSIGWKGIWSVVVILIPYIGLLIYAFVRPTTPLKGNRDTDPTATRTAIDEIHRLVSERDDGAITNSQFASKKAAVLGLLSTEY